MTIKEHNAIIDLKCSSVVVGGVDLKSFFGMSLLIPALNETYLLEKTLEVVFDECEKADIADIIIILCEKSTAECVDISRKLEKQYPDFVKIIFQKRPFIGGAYKDAIEIMTGSHGVIMSADMETDPHLIKDFIKIAKKSPDCVSTASRWMKGGNFKGYNFLKLVCNFVFQKIMQIMFFSKLSDLTCGYKCLPADLLKNTEWLEEKHPVFLEMTLKPLVLGYEFAEIPMKWKPRTEGTSQNSFFQNFKYFKTAFRIRFTHK